MARFSYNPANTTVTLGDFGSLTVGAASIVTSNGSTLHIRTTVSGSLEGTLDVIYTGNFTTIAGVPTGGTFTGLRVDFNNVTVLEVSDFSLPFSATQSPNFDSLVATILEGNDVLTGAALADVLEGFAGIDNIDGGSGADFVQGNAGNDSLIGGDGADVVRGGRDDDVLAGGAGDDFISGDRGADTVTGGAGADIFHTFTGAATDRVTDFSRADGDRVGVLSGATYTVSQSGADVVVDLGGGNQMILVGVQQSALTDGWIFEI